MEIAILQKKIYELRGYRVMLDFDLATLYRVETRLLKQAVKRNRERFPSDFMFILTEKEINLMVSQNVIPSKSYFGGALPFAFTEHGITMLSSILKSKKAIEVNISIVRAFVMMRQLAGNYKEIMDKIVALENRYNKNFTDVYEALDILLQDKESQEDLSKRKRIGYRQKNDKE